MKKQKIAITICKIGVENGVLPDWYLLYPAGWNELVTGEKFLVDADAYALVAKNFAATGRDVVVDYEHQTLGDGPAPAAGWIRDLKFDASGIWERIEWTEKAKAYLVAGEYRYYSPVSLFRESDNRLIMIHSVALTNSPKTKNIQPLVAKLMGTVETHGRASLPPNNNQEEDKMLKKLLAKLGLAEDADETAAIARLDEIIAAGEKEPETVEVVAKDVITALGLEESADVSTVVASIHAIKQKPKGMVTREEFDAVVAKLADKDAADAVTAAVTAGKITPDQKDWAMDYAKKDLPGFKAFIAKAPVVVPVTRIASKKEAADKFAADETTLAIAKMFGNTADDLKKYGVGETA